VRSTMRSDESWKVPSSSCEVTDGLPTGARARQIAFLDSRFRFAVEHRGRREDLRAAERQHELAVEWMAKERTVPSPISTASC